MTFGWTGIRNCMLSAHVFCSWSKAKMEALILPGRELPVWSQSVNTDFFFVSSS